MGPTYNPSTDIPALASKVILITGFTAGLGYETALQLFAHKPAVLYLAARSKEKAEKAIAKLVAAVPDGDPSSLKFLHMDLASLASVKEAAERVIAESERLDILINNAGVLCLPPGLTEDGFEIKFGTNHVGPFYLTKLLLPLLLKIADGSPRHEEQRDVRVVNLSSEGHKMSSKSIPFETYTTTMSNYIPMRPYFQSKLANVLFTKSLAKKYPSILSVSIDPGRVKTDLVEPWREMGGFWFNFVKALDKFYVTLPVEEGAWGQIYAATGDRKTLKNGAHYIPFRSEGKESKLARDEKFAEVLWEWTEKEIASRGF